MVLKNKLNDIIIAPV